MPKPRSLEEWARKRAGAVELPSCVCGQIPDDGRFHAFCTNHARMAKAIEESAYAYASQQAMAMRERAARLAKSFERSEMASHSEVCGCPEVEHAAMWEVQDRLAAAIRALEVETRA